MLFFGFNCHSQTFLEAYENTRDFPPSENLNGLSNAEFSTLTGNANEWSKISGVFYEFDDINFGKRGIEGSNYLFEKWENDVLIIAGEKRYKIDNMNYNVKMQRFESKLGKDSLFVYDMHSLSKLYVNGMQFESIYNYKENANVIYQVLYASEDFSLLKGYDVKVIPGSPDPMINRSKTVIKKTELYYVQSKENGLYEIRLNKKDIINAVTSNKDEKEKLDDYIKDNKLSVKVEKDLISLCKYAEAL